MIFQHTWQAVIEGRKTQTARLVKPGHMFSTSTDGNNGRVSNYIGASYQDVMFAEHGHPEMGGGYGYDDSHDWRTVYEVGKSYAVQPGRGKASVARIRITSIERQDVREYTHEDVRREGFDSKFRFMDVWCCMHDKDAARAAGVYFARRGEPVFDAGDALSIYKLMYEGRPADRYDAWVIRFELVTEGVKA